MVVWIFAEGRRDDGTDLSERTDHIKTSIRNMADIDAELLQSGGATGVPEGSPENPSHRIATVANAITLCRLFLTFAFLGLFAAGQDRHVALGLYALAAATDFLDGQVARRTRTVSWAGKIMDPIMDRILLFTGVIGLMIVGELPVWVAVFVIGRDAYLAIGAWVLQGFRHRPVDVVYIGKVTTALLMVGFCDLLLGVPRVPGLGVTTLPWLPGLNSTASAVGIFLVYAGVVCSALTATIYTHEGVRIIRAGRSGGVRG